MQDTVKIENNPSLVKDTNTGAIINVDHDAYRSALVRRQKNKEIELLKKQLADLTRRVKTLEDIINT